VQDSDRSLGHGAMGAACQGSSNHHSNRALCGIYVHDLPFRFPRPNHRRRVRVLHHDPIPRRAGRYGALNRFDTMPSRPHLADLQEDDGAVLIGGSAGVAAAHLMGASAGPERGGSRSDEATSEALE
jgi:hypothetical protein